jgi:hypothetical protein
MTIQRSPENRGFQGKPYTRPLNFLLTFTGVAGQNFPIWLPKNAWFEVAEVLIKGTVAVEYQLADTIPQAIIGFVGVDGVNFAVWQHTLAGVRSNNYANSALLLVDPVGVAATVHGSVYGWEVTSDGTYRTGS